MDTREYLQALMTGQDAPRTARRRRGGLAGIWDRNKNVITPAVSGALGLVPGIGIGLGAAAGGLMRGLDREGKGGVGFDAGQGAKGALEGGLSAWTARGVRGLLAPDGSDAAQGALQRARQARPTTSIGATQSAGVGFGGAPVGEVNFAASNIPSAAASASSVASPMAAQAGRGRGLSGVLNFAKQNPEAVGAGLQAGSAILGSQAERRMANERIRLERERYEEERRRRETIAALLLPQFSPDTFGRR